MAKNADCAGKVHGKTAIACPSSNAKVGATSQADGWIFAATATPGSLPAVDITGLG
jgi:hypothetical protein